MIVLYAEKEDMGIKYAAALGGIQYEDKLIDIDMLPSYQDRIKKEIADKKGYITTKYEGKEYVVTWGWGHFGTLKDIKDYDPTISKWWEIPLPYFPKKYEVKRIENQNEYFRKRDDRQFETVKKIFNSPKCEYIINGTDWEREGELIFAYIYDLTGTKKPYKRLRSNAKTKSQIRKDFSKLVESTENFPNVVAARGRGIADWTIGINMTIAATLYLSKDRKLLNVGRVLTPTLALIVDREREIRDFVEETNYGVSAEFKTGDSTYKGKCEELYKDRAKAESIMRSLSDTGKIASVEIKTEKKRPPLMHNTQTLQIEANTIYGFTLERTLQIAQKLYENGYTTYPRVDSQYLTEDKIAEMPRLLKLLEDYPPYKGKLLISNYEIPKRYFNNSKVDGHDAIITTDVIPKSLSDEESKIYDLIARRMIMATMPDAEIEKTSVITEVKDGSGETMEFKSSGSRYRIKGFMSLMPGKKTEDNPLPPLKELETVTGTYEIYEQTSVPPSRYTDGTLIKAMENCGRKMEDDKAKELLKKTKGIGRPATRAAIMEKLVRANYVERKGKTIYPTQKGMDTIDAITIDDIKSPILTADWEEKLDEIEKAAPDKAVGLLNRFIGDIKDKTTLWTREMEAHKVTPVSSSAETDFVCPACGKPMLEGKDNYYCSEYKNGCKQNIKKEMYGKKLTQKMVTDLIQKGETGNINGFKSRAGNEFSGKLKLVDGYICANPDCRKLQSFREEGCYACNSALSPDPGNRKVVGIEFAKRRKI